MSWLKQKENETFILYQDIIELRKKKKNLQTNLYNFSQL